MFSSMTKKICDVIHHTYSKLWDATQIYEFKTKIHDDEQST